MDFWKPGEEYPDGFEKLDEFQQQRVKSFGTNNI
jgi:hypothetical protein